MGKIDYTVKDDIKYMLDVIWRHLNEDNLYQGEITHLKRIKKTYLSKEWEE